MNYDLELDKVVSQINKQKAKRVCLQLAEGLKPKAAEIQRELQSKTRSDILIWADTCFGACDTPDLSKLNIDLLIQFGHSEWR
jgi:2-(3-amino-3-carboxypropyl)histidine synthase